MDWAKSMLESAPDGALFLVDQHEKPRGRHGRLWQFCEGQLLLTFVLKSKLDLVGELRRVRTTAHPSSEHRRRIEGYERFQNNILTSLCMATSLGFLEPLKKYGAGLKWPNDFVINHKKIGGMLLEPVWQGDYLAGVVVGFGLNIHNTFDESDELFSKATSLKMITSKELDKAILQNELCESLDYFYALWREKEYETIFSLWRAAQAYLGEELTFHLCSGERVTGVMKEVKPNGDVIIEKKVLDTKGAVNHAVWAAAHPAAPDTSTELSINSGYERIPFHDVMNVSYRSSSCG